MWGKSPAQGMGKQRGTRWGGQEKGGGVHSPPYHVLLTGGGSATVPRHRGDGQEGDPNPESLTLHQNQAQEEGNTGLAPALHGLFLLGWAGGGGFPNPQPPPLPPGLVPEPKGQVEETGTLWENPGGENPPRPVSPPITALHPTPCSHSTPQQGSRALHLLALLQNCLFFFSTKR